MGLKKTRLAQVVIWGEDGIGSGIKECLPKDDVGWMEEVRKEGDEERVEASVDRDGEEWARGTDWAGEEKGEKN